MHLGTYMHAADAAVAYDRAARRFREPGCALNFKHELYEDDWFLRTHGHLDEDAFVLQLREFAYALLNWCARLGFLGGAQCEPHTLLAYCSW